MPCGMTVPLAKEDRKSTSLNSSHLVISYAVFCLQKKCVSPYDRVSIHQSRARRKSPSPRSLPASPFFFKDPATPEIYTLSLHDALPIWGHPRCWLRLRLPECPSRNSSSPAFCRRV